MRLNQLFRPTTLTERINRRSSLAQLNVRGWQPTNVDNEFKNPDAPGFSVEIDYASVYTGRGRYAIYQGNKKIGHAEQPPYASHLNLRTMH